MTAGHDDLLTALAGAGNAPWAIMPERATALSAIIADLSLGRDVSPPRLKAALSMSAATRAATRVTTVPGPRGTGTTAIVPVRGVVLFDLDFPGLAVGMRQLMATIQELAGDPQIGRIILDVNSPGGAVSGVPEAAATIFAARQKKPIIAVSNWLMASAAYWLGASASQVFTIPSGILGSVGVFALHLDLSRALDAEGITPSYIFAGERKIDANPFEPLSDRARGDIQSDINSVFREFVGAVARGRGVSPETVRNQFGQGGTVMAREAVRLGMAERVVTFEQIIAGSASSPSAPARAAGDGLPSTSSDAAARQRLLRLKALS